MTGLSKAALRAKLDDAGFRLARSHWLAIDRLLKRGNGYVLPAAVVEGAKAWGWTPEMVAGLRKALRP